MKTCLWTRSLHKLKNMNTTISINLGNWKIDIKSRSKNIRRSKSMIFRRNWKGLVVRLNCFIRIQKVSIRNLISSRMSLIKSRSKARSKELSRNHFQRLSSGHRFIMICLNLFQNRKMKSLGLMMSRLSYCKKGTRIRSCIRKQNI